MDRFVNQFSEIGKLNAVMLHRPGDELNQVTPDFFDDMLIDDTLYLPAAQRDHDRFAEILRENGAAVYYLKDLFCEVIANDKLRLQYIEDFLNLAYHFHILTLLLYMEFLGMDILQLFYLKILKILYNNSY